MQKTKLGINANILAGILFFLGFTGNSLVMFLACGYVLLCEKNDWLRKMAFKAMAVYLACSVGVSILSMVDTAIAIPRVFIHNLSLGSVGNILTNAINLIRYIMMGFMGLKAFKNQEINIATIDDAFSSSESEDNQETKVNLEK